MLILPSVLLFGFGSACTEYNINKGSTAGGGTEQVADTGLDLTEPTDTAPPAETGQGTLDNGEPIAEAGADQEIKPLDSVQLDGSASYDPRGLEIVAWQWALAGQPAGSTAALLATDVVRPSFWADLAGDYDFELTVQSSDGTWDTTPDTVTIAAIPADGFYVQLSWDTKADMDLHLLDGRGEIFDNPEDCNFCNMTPKWGASGNLDDPSLDWDTIYDGFGPETITIDEPSTGTYTAMVHYYGQNGDARCPGTCPATEATVDIYIGGTLAASHTTTLRDQGDTWTVAKVEWPSTAVTTVDSLGSTRLISCDWW